MNQRWIIPLLAACFAGAAFAADCKLESAHPEARADDIFSKKKIVEVMRKVRDYHSRAPRASSALAVYRTACLGKWNVSNLNRRRANDFGFDSWVGLHLNHDFYTHRLERTGEHDLYQDGEPYDRRDVI